MICSRVSTSERLRRLRAVVGTGEDASPYIESGRVYLNVDIPGVDNLTLEGREFPNSKFDDDIDALMSAIEVAFITKEKGNSLLAAMEADD